MFYYVIHGPEVFINTEVICVYLDMEMAYREASFREGKLKTCDVRYFVEEAEFEDFIP